MTNESLKAFIMYLSDCHPFYAQKIIDLNSAPDDRRALEVFISERIYEKQGIRICIDQ